jgi:3,4-dihydroxy-2-butanone 4-phosphate synthase
MADICEAAKEAHPVIVIDDGGRENESYIVRAAQCAIHQRIARIGS